MSEDSYQGDAQFTVSVDGQQIGGVRTVTASHSDGATQTFDITGNWAAGTHDVSVTFVNDAQNNDFGPGSNVVSGTGDRNLYIQGVSYDGTTVDASTTPIYESTIAQPNSATFVSGTRHFTVQDSTDIPEGAGANDVTSPGPAPTVGSGPDKLELSMSEDAYQGDAEFTVSVDGQQVGNTQTVTALHSQGQDQAFTFLGDWGSGDHTVTVNFLNDAYGGNDSVDRNLYVDAINYNGSAGSGTPWELAETGSQTFTVHS